MKPYISDTSCILYVSAAYYMKVIFGILWSKRQNITGIREYKSSTATLKNPSRFANNPLSKPS